MVYHRCGPAQRKLPRPDQLTWNELMNQSYPVPPLELVQQWIKECDNPEEPRWQEYEQDIATKAAKWGADQELEACCKWIPIATPWDEEQLRAARRPKPPSLKEQALKALTAIEGDFNTVGDRADNIRLALEALDD